MTDPERPWKQDPRYNPDLRPATMQMYSGGARFRVKGNKHPLGLNELGLQWHQGGLELGHEGDGSTTSLALSLRFGWPEIAKVEKIQNLASWDRGLRFIFYPAFWVGLNKILDFAD